MIHIFLLFTNIFVFCRAKIIVNKVLIFPEGQIHLHNTFQQNIKDMHQQKHTESHQVSDCFCW